MVQLVSYGLTALAAMLVIAFCFAHRDELPQTQGKSSDDQINNAHAIDSPTIPPKARSLPFRGIVGEQHQNVSSSLLRTPQSAETGSGAIYGHSLQSAGGQMEAFRD
jgi:hypothetical protein